MKQLHSVVALAETLHFRHAAERCGISQPSLSAQLQAIEAELGVQLFERSRSRVIVTPTGREVLERARRALSEVQGIEDYAGTVRTGVMAGTIRLGVKPTLGPYLLPHVVAALHSEHPSLKLYVRERPPRGLEDELLRGEHDIVLAHLPVSSADLATERLFREPLYLALAKDHPLATEPELKSTHLSGLTILSLTPQFHLHDQVLVLCRDFGASLELSYEGTSLDALRSMVGMGMGATFLPALYARSELSHASDVVVRHLADRAISRSIGLVWRKSAGRAATYRTITEAVRSVVRTEFPELTIES